MARITHHGKTTGSKLSKGYIATLWVVGIILFAFFAFAIFAACGGLDLIIDTPPQIMIDENGSYFYIDDNGERQYLTLPSGTDVSGTEVSPSNAPASPTDVAE